MRFIMHSSLPVDEFWIRWFWFSSHLGVRRTFRWERRAKICKLFLGIIMRREPEEAKAGGLGVLGGRWKILPGGWECWGCSSWQGFINSTEERNGVLGAVSSRKGCFQCRPCSSSRCRDSLSANCLAPGPLLHVFPSSLPSCQCSQNCKDTSSVQKHNT